jgi:hypothetical protein
MVDMRRVGESGEKMWGREKKRKFLPYVSLYNVTDMWEA